MHPRMRTRRVEVRREAGRRRLRIVVATLVIVGTVAAGWGLTRSPLLDIDDIKVVGVDRADLRTVLALGGLVPGGAMLDVDTRTAAAAMAAEPWVASARVERRWPGTVVVRVTERIPVAAIHLGDDAVLVDRDGRVLSAMAAAEAGDGVVTITAPDDAAIPAPGQALDGLLGAAVAVVAAAADAVPDRQLSLHVDTRGLILGLGDGVDAVVGSADDVGAKLTALVTMLARVEPQRGTTIDLRVPSAPVLIRS